MEQIVTEAMALSRVTLGARLREKIERKLRQMGKEGCACVTTRRWPRCARRSSATDHEHDLSGGVLASRGDTPNLSLRRG